MSDAKLVEGPLISVVVITPTTYGVLRSVLDCLRRQTIRDRMELVVVVPRISTGHVVQTDFQEFLAHRIVEVGAVRRTGAALAAGMRAARAPVVAYAEEHVFPPPRWAEVHVDAHAAGWKVVGGVLANANPTKAVSWAALLTNFGPWVAPVRGGVRDALASHQVSYDRELLIAYGERLDHMMESEATLHEDLLAQGHQLYVEDRVQTPHVNESRLVSYLLSRTWGARLYAAAAVEEASRARRLRLAALTPTIAPHALVETRRHLMRMRLPPGLAARVLAVAFLGVIADAAGQTLGYALGPGRAAEHKMHIELERCSHLAERDVVRSEPSPVRG